MGNQSHPLIRPTSLASCLRRFFSAEQICTFSPKLPNIKNWYDQDFKNCLSETPEAWLSPRGKKYGPTMFSSGSHSREKRSRDTFHLLTLTCQCAIIVCSPFLPCLNIQWVLEKVWESKQFSSSHCIFGLAWGITTRLKDNNLQSWQQCLVCLFVNCGQRGCQRWCEREGTGGIASRRRDPRRRRRRSPRRGKEVRGAAGSTHYMCEWAPAIEALLHV